MYETRLRQELQFVVSMELMEQRLRRQRQAAEAVYDGAQARFFDRNMALNRARERMARQRH